MGYYTRFELGYDSRYSDEVELERFIEDMNAEKTFGSYELSMDSYSWDTMKWYEHQSDMKELSKSYPNVLFVLIGSGEESGDLWREYYMNGDVQRENAIITYADPDMSNFKRVDLSARRKSELEAERARLEAERARIQTELDKLNGT